MSNSTPPPSIPNQSNPPPTTANVSNDPSHAAVATQQSQTPASANGIDTLLAAFQSSCIPQEFQTNNAPDEHVPIVVSEACYRMAKHMSDVAFDFLLVNDDDCDDNELNEDDSSCNNAKERLTSLSLAAKLRCSQHRVLLACTMNLRDHANQIKGVSL